MPKPIKFKTNEGKIFNIKILKTNIRTYWIELLNVKPIKVIKIKKRSKKLIY